MPKLPNQKPNMSAFERRRDLGSVCLSVRNAQYAPSVIRVGKVGNYPGEKHWVITGEKGHRVNIPSEKKKGKT